jgi:hypothetical protein
MARSRIPPAIGIPPGVPKEVRNVNVFKDLGACPFIDEQR